MENLIKRYMSVDKISMDGDVIKPSNIAGPNEYSYEIEEINKSI